MIRLANDSDTKNIKTLQEKFFPNEELNFTSQLGYVIYNQDEFIGYVTFLVIEDYADCLFMAIDDQFQGQGYGSKLFLFAFNDLKKRNITKLNLEVRANNIKALKIYQSAGLKLARAIPNYYHNPKEDAYALYWEKEE